MSLREKMYAIMSELPFIQKDGHNDHFGYNFASEKAIKQAIQPLLIKYKVLFSLSVEGQSVHDGLTLAKFRFEFADVETTEAVSGNFEGQGLDKGDKGLYKAITGAIKYILTSTFLIPTGDDPEHEKGRAKKDKRSGEPQKVMGNPLDSNDVPF